MANGLNFSRRLRRTPYTNRVEACGVRGFSVVNHMLLPKAYNRSIEEDYWHLREHVQIWDVACQRQVEIVGPNAAALIQLMTPRDIRDAEVGDCLYLPLIDAQAGLINDPVLLKLARDRYWLSIADSDVLLFAKGLALGNKMQEIYLVRVQRYSTACCSLGLLQTRWLRNLFTGSTFGGGAVGRRLAGGSKLRSYARLSKFN